VQSGARELALETLIFDASDPGRFESIFAEAANRKVNGLAGMASPFLNFHHKRLVDLANQYRLPSIWEASGYVRDGGMLSYGPVFPTCIGNLLVTLLRFCVAPNQKTAKSLGIVFSPALLSRADEVIE
jgi:putative ABC transport system substrate-binding protein